MKVSFKIFLLILLISTAHTNGLNNPLKVTIQKIDSNVIELPAMDLKVGETGIVNHYFGDNYQGIIGLIEIIRIDSGVAYAKLMDRGILMQKHLPNPTAKITQGDEVYFRLLNNQAFIIAPDLKTYEKVQSQNSDMTFLNSDLMMGYLMDKSGFDPKPKFFNQVCEIYNVGLLYVITQNRLNIADCQSLIVLESKEFDTTEVKETSSPFFSRVLYTSSGSLDSSIKKRRSRDYFEYYGRFIQEGRNFKPKDIKKSKNKKAR